MYVRAFLLNMPKQNELHRIFSPEAEEQLADLYNYIADAASPDVAMRYVESIIAHCEDLSTFPLQGIARDDVRPGLRITHYKKRAIIAFAVDEPERHVYILGIFYGGQDYETLLHEDFSGNND